MNSIHQKVVFSQIFVHATAILIILIVSILSAPRFFERAYIFSWATAISVSTYIKFLIPITLTAFTLCFSSVIRHGDIDALNSPSFFNVIRGALTFLFVMFILYMVLVFFVWPWASHRSSDTEYRSQFVNDAIAQSIEHINQGELSAADREIGNVLRLLPLHEEANKIFEEIQAMLPESSVIPQKEEPAPLLPLGLEYSEISARAEEYFAAQDFFSALFYARLALGPRELRDDPMARRILSESLKMIERMDISEAEQEEREIFYLKRSAARAYNNGEYINAYYIFKEIQKKNPFDRDAEVYLGDIQPRMEDISFFIDEIDSVEFDEIQGRVFTRLPILTEGMRLAERMELAEGNRRFLAAEQIMRNSIGLYFIDLEYLEIDNAGNIEMHIKIPRAKLSGTGIIMRAIDREQNREIHVPEYLHGQSDIDFLELFITADELWLLNPVTAHFSEIDIIQLFSFVRLYPEFGRNSAFPQSEIIYRILLLPSLIICSLLVIGVSWQQRSRYIGRQPLYTFILFIPVIFFLFVFFELYIAVNHNVLMGILFLGNFTAALIALIVSQALLFFMAIVILSGQKVT